ncbi:MAG: serine hydrolase [Dysgonamonadaceae bacterium]|jgi:beta-glucosidase-like glycosyl hydrolase/CubicO group peptidase (beta-lactamase class C family)|nr:serine hydrolase [Dysgonamonadaceae bacterium]
MNYIRLFLLLFIFPIALQSQQQPNLFNRVDRQKMEAWVDSVFNGMTLDDRIGQFLMITVDPKPGQRNKTHVLQYIKNQKIGGILFAEGTLDDQAESTNLYQQASKIPLLIAFDGEWGLSMRLSNTLRFPKNMLLGAIADNQLLYLYGNEIGRECRELGVHVNFAPVLDVNNNPRNPVIGVRSFGEDPELVAAKGIAYAKGLENAGVIAVGKHFPGHGDTSDDSHKLLPKIDHPEAHLQQTELYPFRQFINEGFAGIMTGHLSVPALETVAGRPATLSPDIIHNLLHQKMGFDGLIFTDALDMKSVKSGNTGVKALLAGNDILLNPLRPSAVIDSIKKALDTGILTQTLIEEKCRKILRYKYLAGLNSYSPIRTQGLHERIRSSYAEWLSRKLYMEGMTLLKNEHDLIPVADLEKTRIAALSIGMDKANAFDETLSLYGKIDRYAVNTAAGKEEIAALLRQLKTYDLVVCGVFHDKMSDYSFLQQLAEAKKLILCFFVSPYRMSNFRDAIEAADGVVMAYENAIDAREAAAQLVMGGIAAKGKLPVSVTGLFDRGAGLTTSKSRLAYHEPLEVGMSAQKLAEIEEIVNEGIKEKAFPGCQVLVAKNGIVVYRKSFGYFDYDSTHPVRDADIYDLASVTKVTATLPAVMKLYDTHRFQLQDKLSKYIPALKNSDKSPITIEAALFHQSGLTPTLPFYKAAIDENSYSGSLYSRKRDSVYHVEYDANQFFRTDFKFKPTLVSTVPHKHFPLQVANHFYLNDCFSDTVMNQIVRSTLTKNPGYVYSDLNFILLKELVEHVSKRKLNEFVDTEFFAGLGANYTLYNPLQRIDASAIAPTEYDAFLRNQLLTGFVHDEAAAFLGGVSGNAGLFSNANDLAKLLQMFLNEGVYGGKTFLSSATCRVFTETKSKKSRRGLGFDKPNPDNPDASPTCESAPAAVYGHTGYTGTCFWVDPDNQLIYVFLSNRVYPSRLHKNLMNLNIRPRIQEVIYNALY